MPTRASESVTVIGAEGSAGYLWQLKPGAKVHPMSVPTLDSFSEIADKTFADTELYDTPFGKLHGNRLEGSIVRLLGPDGKPLPGEDFLTPVDWKKSKQE